MRDIVENLKSSTDLPVKNSCEKLLQHSQKVKKFLLRKLCKFA